MMLTVKSKRLAGHWRAGVFFPRNGVEIDPAKVDMKAIKDDPILVVTGENAAPQKQAAKAPAKKAPAKKAPAKKAPAKNAQAQNAPASSAPPVNPKKPEQPENQGKE